MAINIYYRTGGNSRVSTEIKVELKEVSILGNITESGPQGIPGAGYVHPDTHPVSMIVQDEDNVFFTAAEKAAALKIIATSNYEHTQLIASDNWIVVHFLDKKPAVTVVDSADTVVVGEIIYLNNDTVELRFNGQFSGKAYFN